MKPGDVYRRAAEFLESQPPYESMGMCDAIDEVLAKNGAMIPSYRIAVCRALLIFSRTVKPYRIWWGCEWSDDLQERQNCRVLALLFAAAMADAGDE